MSAKIPLFSSAALMATALLALWAVPGEAAKRPSHSRSPHATTQPRTPALSAPAPEPAIAATQPALPPPPALPDRFTAVALAPLLVRATPEETVHRIEISLLNEIDEMAGRRAVSPQDVDTDLKKSGLSIAACDRRTECLAQAGRFARAHYLVEAETAASGDSVTLSLRLIDTQSGAEVTSVADVLGEDAAEAAATLHRLAVQLLAPDTYTGSLIIQCAVAGADVYVDDRLVGITPLAEPVGTLRAGPHILHVSKVGFAEFYRFVDVAYRRAAIVQVDLQGNTIAGVIMETESKTGLGSLFVGSDEPGIEIRVDAEPKGRTPLGAAIEQIPAGQRRLSLRKEGLAPAVTDVQIVAGKRVDVFVQARNGTIVVTGSAVELWASPLPGSGRPLAAAVALPEARTWRRPTAFAVGGAGVVGLGLSAYFAHRVGSATDQAASISEHWQASPPTSHAEMEQMQADAVTLAKLNKQGPRDVRGQWIALGVGATLLFGGVGLYFSEAKVHADGAATTTAENPRLYLSWQPGRLTAALAW